MEKSIRLQALRGLAVTLVVCFHLGLSSFRNGWIGVDIFFVISGFLMWQLYSNSIQAGEFLDFYKRRLMRLLPALSFLLLMSNVIFYLRFLPFERKDFNIENFWAALFMSNLHYWAGDQYFSNESLRPLLNLWSISLEIQFYLIFPLIVLLVKKSKFRLQLLFSVCFIIYFLLSLISPKTAFYLLPGRVWEFLLGVSVGFFNTQKQVNKRTVWATSIFCYLVLFLGLRLELNRLGSIVYQIISILSFSVLIWCSWKRLSAGFMTRVLARIGDYSYSIYLFHFPLIVLLGYEPFSGNPNSLKGGNQYLLFFILLGLFSWLCKHFVEDSSQLKRNFLKFWALSTVISIGGLVAPSSLNVAGYSKAEISISNAMEDRGEFRCGVLLRLSYINQPFKSCKISSRDKLEKVLLLGNSHADAIKFTVAKSIPGKDLYLLNENNPLTSYSLHTYKRGVLRLSPSIVILHSSPGSTDLQSLVNFASFLKERSIRFFIISPVPRPGQDVPKLLLSMIRNNEKLSKPELAGFNSERYLTENSTELNSLTRIALDYSVVVIPTVDLFCNPSCRLLESKGFKPYYFDSNHLTLTGSNLLYERLLAVLNN